MEGIYGPGQRIIIDQVAKELGLSTIPNPIEELVRQNRVNTITAFKTAKP